MCVASVQAQAVISNIHFDNECCTTEGTKGQKTNRRISEGYYLDMRI